MNTTQERKTYRRPTFWSFVRHLGLIGALKHYYRVARNRFSDFLFRHPKRVYQCIAVAPLLLGAVGGGLLATITYSDPWWGITATIGGIGLFLFGVVATVILANVSALQFLPVGDLLFFGAARLVGVGVLLGLAGILGQTAADRASWAIAAGALLYLFFPVLARTARFLTWQSTQPHVQKKITWDEASLTDDQIWRLCVHELGHALGFGLLNRLPEDACAGINTDVNNSIGGYAWGMWQLNALDMTDDLVDMILIQLVAGSTAEKLICGSRSYGDTDDMAKFNELIKRRCAHSFLNGYIDNPQSDYDRHHNSRLERRHRAHICALAEQLVENNVELINEMAPKLKKLEFLDSHELTEFWKAIRIPLQLKPIDVPANIPCLPSEAIN